MRKISLLLVFTLLFALTLPALTACHGAIGYAGFAIPEDFSPDEDYEILSLNFRSTTRISRSTSFCTLITARYTRRL